MFSIRAWAKSTPTVQAIMLRKRENILLLSSSNVLFVSTHFLHSGYQGFEQFGEIKVNNICQYCLKQCAGE